MTIYIDWFCNAHDITKFSIIVIKSINDDHKTFLGGGGKIVALICDIYFLYILHIFY